MRKYFLHLICFFVLIGDSLQAKEVKYPTLTIPADLVKNADIVIREYSTQLLIQSESKAILKVHVVKTVLTEAGRKQASLFESYDKFNKLSITSAVIYNEFGVEIKKIKNSEIKDFSLVNGYTLYDDSRAKYVNYTANKLPYTVDYTYETEMNGFVGFPTWMPMDDDRQSLQSAEMVVEVPSSYKLRFLQFNVNPPDSSNNGKVTHYRWSISNKDAYSDEDYLPNEYTFLPSVFFAPSTFFFDKSSGDLTTWKSSGRWTRDLIEGRDVLPTATIDKIKELVAGVTDKREIIKRVYKYMQSRTRYVSIQLGIGGLQPFPATVVEETGYGDCKALTNYTKALLKVAGIKGYYTEIGVAGHEITFPNFSSLNQMNHVVLSIPMEKDTVWLECTSQRNPFYYVPPSLVNRYALMVTERGGVLVKTPVRKFSDNREERRIDVAIDMAGDASFEVKSKFYGNQVVNVFPEAWYSRKDQEEALYKEYSLPGIKILDFGIAVSEGDTVTSSSYVKASVPKLASKTGSRLFVPAVPVNPFDKILAKPTSRKMDFKIGSGWLDRDTIVITIPTGFKVEAMPEKKSIESEFGTYKLSCTSKGAKIIVVREMAVYRNSYPAEKYNAYVDFINSATKADRALCVIMPE
ncbi:MAG TPA: DUF3857 domain-containing protein [Williamwhitmania sp.]|nr:DUF3857 domain-containing protein [Williamwhitmania sp.]